MVVETSGRCERLEREECSEKEDNHRCLAHNKDSQVTLGWHIRTALLTTLSFSCWDKIVAKGRERTNR